MKLFLSCLAWFVLFGCATSGSQTTKLRMGMTREEVIHIMGHPIAVSASEDTEFLHYQVAPDWALGDPTVASPYQVALRDGHVVAYGNLSAPIHTVQDIRYSGAMTNVIRNEGITTNVIEKRKR
jgi:hypothetical protein